MNPGDAGDFTAAAAYDVGGRSVGLEERCGTDVAGDDDASRACDIAICAVQNSRNEYFFLLINAR